MNCKSLLAVAVLVVALGNLSIYGGSSAKAQEGGANAEYAYSDGGCKTQSSLPNIRNAQVRYMRPVLEALCALGGSAKRLAVHEWIADNYDIPENETEKLDKGGTRFAKHVDWARNTLREAGLILMSEKGKRGIWTLTEKGNEIRLSDDDARRIYAEVQAKQKQSSKTAEKGTSRAPTGGEDATSGEGIPPDEIRENLVRLLQKMTPQGFEKFCVLFLDKMDFESVEVTGKSGDQGIDGKGFYSINRLIRGRMMFQSKLYKHAVGPAEIRDFRGSIDGRAGRGVFITTGGFTKGAKEEAMRENTIPIELVSIDRLLDLMIEERLGVKGVGELEIDEDFFKPYMRKE